MSLNYIPILYPNFTPAVIEMKPGRRELWRVANASADTIIDLQLQYDGAAQPLQVVALDGVPTGSQDGTMQGDSSRRPIFCGPRRPRRIHRDGAVEQGQKRELL